MFSGDLCPRVPKGLLFLIDFFYSFVEEKYNSNVFFNYLPLKYLGRCGEGMDESVMNTRG